MSGMKLPWVPHIPVDGEVRKWQEDAAYANTRYDHLCKLNIRSEGARVKVTGLICTIGPASRSPEVLQKLMEAGMTCARLNFSHGTHEYHAETVFNIREAVANYSKKLDRIFPLAIALDTKGPEIRTGLVEGGRSATFKWEKGDEVKLTTNKEYFEKGTKNLLYIDYDRITSVIKADNRIYVEDGNMSLIVKEVGSDFLKCVVETGGVVSAQKGVNLPGVPVDLPAITEKDKEDIKFAVKHKLDMVFASFIRDAKAVREIRTLLGEEGRGLMIIPKIENQQGMDNIDEIIAECDGIMVARGDLAVEIPFEKVFLAQKMIIAKCNLVGKPVICATQMLESMTNKPTPTRAEASDVANAVLDGADCVMLSGETAKGDYPVKCVEAMTKICKEAEVAVYQKQLESDLKSKIIVPVDPAHGIAIAASEVAAKCKASAIVCVTSSGRTGKLLCRYRPRCPVICVTRYGLTARQLQMFRPSIPLQFITEHIEDWFKDIDARLLFGINYGKRIGLIHKGDALVLVSGWRAGSGFTNTLRIVYASAIEA